MSALVVSDLTVNYGALPVLHGISLAVEPGECLGLVGESGCGKSTIALAALRALPRGGRIAGGCVTIGGQDVTMLNRAAMRPIWAHQVSMVYQDPSRALNPTMTVAAQLREAYQVAGVPPAELRGKEAAALTRVRIADPARVLAAYPHQLSGGMQQRVVIAMALAKNPQLLVLDEPTTGLDATVEADILQTIGAIRRDFGTAVLLISHNLPLVGRMADRVGVLYAGVLVEEGEATRVLNQPRHPYTTRLLQCLPQSGLLKSGGQLETIPGQLPRIGANPPGCVFAPRCSAVQPICEAAPPPVHGPAGHRARCHFDPPFGTTTRAHNSMAEPRRNGAVLIDVAHLTKTFGSAGKSVRAVTDISFDVASGETLGLVGESGSGKTTLARMLLGLVEPDPGGAITLDGQILPSTLARRRRADRKALQIVFQNPDSALNRSQTVRNILTYPLSRLAALRRVALADRLIGLAEAVRLGAPQLSHRPRALSGGLKQRVAIARAFAGNPRVVICDEPTSALDVSVQAAILNLLADLQARDQVSYIFISHDLNVIRFIADRVAVLYAGRIMEIGPAEAVFAGPHHPYTAALMEAAAGRAESRGGDVAPDAGCAFQNRCQRKLGAVCESVEPDLGGGVHQIRCHIPRGDLPRGQ